MFNIHKHAKSQYSHLSFFICIICYHNHALACHKTLLIVTENERDKMHFCVNVRKFISLIAQLHPWRCGISLHNCFETLLSEIPAHVIHVWSTSICLIFLICYILTTLVNICSNVTPSELQLFSTEQLISDSLNFHIVSVLNLVLLGHAFLQWSYLITLPHEIENMSFWYLVYCF